MAMGAGLGLAVAGLVALVGVAVVGRGRKRAGPE
jgi:hypothetical protein